MANRKQRKARRRRAQLATRRSRAVVPEAWLSDHQWLAWTRDHGLDLTDRGQLLDAAAVGLSVLCWRNTSLEDVHAGQERFERLERDGSDLDDPAVLAEEKQARREHDRALYADWDALADVDGDESRRIGVLLDGREWGFGIPDIMMRLNISTALDVREVLDYSLTEPVTEPGAELAYHRRGVPGHVVELLELLQDPGGSCWWVGPT